MPEVVPFFSEMVQSRLSSIYYCSQSIITEASKHSGIDLRPMHPVGDEWGDGDSFWEPERKGKLKYIPYTRDSYTSLIFGYANESMRSVKKVKDFYVILNQQVTASFGLRRYLSIPMVGFTPTIIHYVSFGDIEEPAAALYKSLPFETMASMVANWNLFHNQRHLDRTYEKIRTLFSPALIRQFSNRSISAGNLGIETSRIDAVPELFKDYAPEKFILLYGGRLPQYKGVDIMIEVTKYLNKMGIPAQLEVFATMTEPSGKISRYTEQAKLMSEPPMINVRVNDTQDNFFAMAKRASVFVCPSQMEAYGISYAEMMYCGAIGVFFKRKWLGTLVPSDYKYTVSTVSEAVYTLATIYKNGGDPDHVKDTQAYLRKEHDRSSHARKVLDYTTELSKAMRSKKHVTSWKEIL